MQEDKINLNDSDDSDKNNKRSHMNEDTHILIADDDMGHATLIMKNLKRAGLPNNITHFKDGSDLLDFLFEKKARVASENESYFLLLLDIRMPKIDGIEALTRIKGDPELKKIPVIMLTTTDDPREIENCHALGCNSYIVKPVNYDKFVAAIKKLGIFLQVIEVPKVDQNA